MLGDTGGDRIDALVHDLVDTSYETGTIVQSPDDRQGHGRAARRSCSRRSTRSRCERAGEQRVRHVITNLMQYFLEHPEEMGDEPAVRGGARRALTLDGRRRRRGRPAAPAPIGRTASSASRRSPTTSPGMTDRYAISRYRELFEPRSWAT